VERITAILCHASTRALVLLGVSKKRYMLVFWGFLIFTLLDGVAGGVHVAGLMGKISVWWIELAILPFAAVSVPVLVWCYRRWPEEHPGDSSAVAAGPELGEGPQTATEDDDARASN
jgi:hypothetical protein